MKYDFMYKRGFLFTNNPDNFKKLEVSYGWEQFKINNYYFFVDTLVQTEVYTTERISIFIIGTILDPINKENIPKAIAKNLADKFLENTENFYGYLEYLSGRFSLFVFTKTKSLVLQDGVGSRSVFYNIEGKDTYISSHPELIAELNNYSVGEKEKEFMNSTEYQNNIDSYFPGISTPYKEVKMLTPNTLLHIEKREVERFFPRFNLIKQKVNSELGSELAQFFINQTNMLSEHYKLSISLTAGLDSRLSLATSKDISKTILYYTLTYGNDSEKDAEVAKEISEILDIKHLVIPTKNETDKKFLNLFHKNTSNMSSDFRGKIAETLYTEYPAELLHLKSNGSEICRAYYRQSFALLPKGISANMYAKLYGIKSRSKYVVECFNEYIEVTQLNKYNIANYDHYDLFYWELRIGNWQGLCLYEWDIGQDTFIAFGNRYMINKMLGIPLQDRLNDKIYYEIINSVWPETLEKDINPYRSKKNPKFKLLKRAVRRVKLAIK